MLKFRNAIAVLLVLPALAHGQEVPLAADQPRPTPLTRPALKEAIEQVKDRVPRIPLPPLTASDEAALGDNADHYEHRLRYHYLGGNARRSGRSRQPDPAMTLPYDFKVQLFWIVSRVNNCQYCIGHQETKLLAAGIKEDEIAQLDQNWAAFPESRRAAFAFARTLTRDPSAISDESFQTLQQHFTDEQILEMTISIAWNNSINRWKEALAVPQDPDEGGYSRALRDPTAEEAGQLKHRPHGSYITPTSPEFATKISSLVLPAELIEGAEAYAPTRRDPGRNRRVDVEPLLALGAKREARLPLASEEATRKVFDGIIDDLQRPPLWMRALAVFPVEGARRVQRFLSSADSQALSPVMRARLTWVVAREDNAAYVLGLAKSQLEQQGVWDRELDHLEGDWSGYDGASRALLQLARDLAHSPVVLSDATVAHAVEQAGPAAVVQTVSHVVAQTALVRLSEAARLPIVSSD